MRVDLTARARADLRAIGRWIARHDPERAISFVAELRDKALGLSTSYQLYPPLPGLDPALHRMNHRDYRVLYHVDEGAGVVTVLHIHHGRRANPLE